MNEKKVNKEAEQYANDVYMKKWIQMTEEENARRKAIEDAKQ